MGEFVVVVVVFSFFLLSSSHPPTYSIKKGTCAGMILLSNTITSQKKGGQPTIGGLDVTVRRNAFGRQRDSFEMELSIIGIDEDPEDVAYDGGIGGGGGSSSFRGVFIRAPVIEVVEGKGVEVIASIPAPSAPSPVSTVQQQSQQNEPQQHEQQQQQNRIAVAVRQGHIFATAFHPELTHDDRVHRMFARAVWKAKLARLAK